jgi:hypothetical protein
MYISWEQFNSSKLPSKEILLCKCLEDLKCHFNLYNYPPVLQISSRWLEPLNHCESIRNCNLELVVWPGGEPIDLDSCWFYVGISAVPRPTSHMLNVVHQLDVTAAPVRMIFLSQSSPHKFLHFRRGATSFEHLLGLESI